MPDKELYINHVVSFANGKVSIDGTIAFEQLGDESIIQLMKRIFRETDKSYSKFHKMDRISKLAYVTSELLIKQTDLQNIDRNNVAMLFSNSSATIETDSKFQVSLNEIPSPALFVYTLPNIMVGEICIRNNFKGENLFFIEPTYNAELLVRNTQLLFTNSNTQLAVLAWVDFFSTDNYECYMALISTEKKGSLLSEENLNSHFK